MEQESRALDAYRDLARKMREWAAELAETDPADATYLEDFAGDLAGYLARWVVDEGPPLAA